MMIAPSYLKALAAVGLAALVGACASRPPPPDWQMNAKGASESAITAYFKGDTRVEVMEFDRMRREIARTGDINLMARAELLRCATRVASLVLEDCAAFEALRADAATPARAYADYLTGRLRPGTWPCCRHNTVPLPHACWRAGQ